MCQRTSCPGMIGKVEIMRTTVCEMNQCTGCKACMEICPKDALRFEDAVHAMNVFIDEKKCINCNACHDVCQANQPADLDLAKPIYWKQGWAGEEVRRSSSSGGFAAQLMRSFMDDNSYVCSCILSEGRFRYYVTNKIEEVEKYQGSKYVKSDPEGIYKEVRGLLKQEKRVLFIGLPCHVAAMNKFLKDREKENLYTVDLICHGSPSPEILRSFLTEHNYDIHTLADVRFRIKNTFGVFPDAGSIAPVGSLDRYSIGFLRGLFYTENCYSCHYARLERCSDMTIGDSWGTDLTEEAGHGISLALCQSQKGKDLLLHAGLELFDVDIDQAAAANHQLEHPSEKTPARERFFTNYRRTGSVDRAVFAGLRKECLKQSMKGILIRLHLMRGGADSR